MSDGGWPYMSDAEIDFWSCLIKGGYRPPGIPDPHTIRIERNWAEILGYRCRYWYQATCSCGWAGDGTKSKVTAERQAEWHAGPKPNEVEGWC